MWQDNNTKKGKCTYSNCWIYLIKLWTNRAHNVSILVKNIGLKEVTAFIIFHCKYL